MPPKQEVTRERVLSTALDVIREQGLDFVTARGLAQRLGCSTQPVYSAFTNMDELKAAAYDRAFQFARERIRGYRDTRYPPPLCLAIGYLQLAHEERQLFRSVYLSGFDARLARNNLLIGEEMVASHVPDSSRLRNAGINLLKRIYTKISIYIAGLAAMINTGAIEFTIEQAAQQVIDIYETIITGELGKPMGEEAMRHEALGEKIGSGANADVYRYGEGKVVKLFRSAGQLHSLHHERRNHLFIEQAGLPVPKVYEPVEIDGLPGLVYEYIEGPTIVDRMFSSDGLEDVKLLARLMHQIHSVSVQGLDDRHIPRVKGSMAWQIDHGSGLTSQERERVKALLQTLPDGNCLCHGDLNPLNVILREDGPVIIDWQGASIGNPAYDVMQVLLIWKCTVVPETLAPPEFIRQFNLHRSELYELMLAEYTSLSSIPRVDIEAWVVPVAASKLANAMSDQERENLLAVIRNGL